MSQVSQTVMSLREHLSELKRRAKVAFVSFGILFVALLAVPADPGSVLSAINGGGGTYVTLIAFFMARVKLSLLPPGWVLIGLNVNAALEVYLLASLLFALIFNAPIFAYEVIMFINPGLKESERKLIFPFISAASALFVVGILFGFFFLAHFLLIALSPFFISTGLNPTISGLDFYTVVFITVAMSGIAFTIPVYVYTLIRLGVVKATTFTKNRLLIWVITYILCAIVTPDGGPLLDIILFVPIIILLEVSVWLGGRGYAGKMKRQAAADAAAGFGPTPPPPPAPPSPSGDTPAPPALPPSAPTTARPVLSLPPAQAPASPLSTTAPKIPVIPRPSGPPVVKRYCLYCAHEMPVNTVFCPNCGKATM
jgi:Tat protein translocase TatC